jgi:hypothetical protein
MSVDPAVAAAVNTYLSLPMNFGEPTNLILIAEKDAWVAAVEWLVGHPDEYARLSRQNPITDEWEYGYELLEQDTRDVVTRGWPFNTWEEAMQHAVGRAEEESDPDTLPLVPQVVRRREAGPWEPVSS